MCRALVLLCTVAAVLAAAFLLSCGGSSSSPSMTSATVKTTISDPATCAAPQGPFSHVYVTVTDVRIHQSANASPMDSGWVDLTPQLANSPVQVDLLAGSNQCFLKTLGSTEIQPGSYQQIRILLASNSTTVGGNQCGASPNCVMLTADVTNTPQPLQLSSESQTGIKIPSGQIAGGQFVVAAGESKDLDVDFNACASIVTQGNGMYRLKPVLHAGEVATQSALSGTVIDAGTQTAIVGGTTVVALEQNDGTGVDRVVMETVTDSAGAFSFCPVAAGTYDVVIAAVNGAGVAYAATVITGVQASGALGTVPLTPVLAPASITGTITTSTGSAATAADISLSALEPITVNNASLLVTVPLAMQSAVTVNVTTASGASCAANTDCASYTLSVPAANPSVGAFSTSGHQTPAPPAAGPVQYTIDAMAFVPGMAGQSDCSPSELQTIKTNTNAPLVVTSGTGVTAATLAFSGCN
jgi:hypothetical protein